MRSRPRLLIAAALTVAALLGAGGAWLLGPHAHDAPSAESSPSETAPVPVPVATSGTAPAPAAPAALGPDALTAAGSEISVGLPATVTLNTGSGDIVYARVTLQELAELAPSDAAAVVAAVPAATGFTTVYAMPATLTVLSIATADGAPTSASSLSAGDLARFSIAVRPGSDPLPSTGTVSSRGCSGLSASSTAIHPGSGLQWCLHAFSGGTVAGTPTGGQYQAATGRYVSPVTWASQTFRPTSEIP